MLFKFKRIVGCIEPWVKNRDTNQIVSWCIVTALMHLNNPIIVGLTVRTPVMLPCLFNTQKSIMSQEKPCIQEHDEETNSCCH